MHGMWNRRRAVVIACVLACSVVAPPVWAQALAEIVGDQIRCAETIAFAVNSTKLTARSEATLKVVASLAQGVSNLSKLRVEVHTDTRGSSRYNKIMSQKRADAIKSFLAQHGLKSSMIEAVGHGEDRPLSRAGSAGANRSNRRIEFHLVR